MKGGDDESADGVAEEDHQKIEKCLNGDDSRRRKIEHVSNRVLEAAQNEGRDAEQNAERRLVIAVEIDGEVDEDPAENRAQKPEPVPLFELPRAESEGGLFQVRQHPSDEIAAKNGADEIAQ